MDGIVDSVVKLIGTYGFRSAAIVVATVIIVNIIKKPIVRLGEKRAQKLGIAKAAATRYVTLLPVVVAFLLELTASLAANGFNFAAVAYGEVISSAVLYGALSVGVYEGIKKQLEAYAVTYNYAARQAEKKSVPDVQAQAQATSVAESAKASNDATESVGETATISFWTNDK